MAILLCAMQQHRDLAVDSIVVLVVKFNLTQEASMLEQAQCIVISAQGSLGLVLEEKRFSMLRSFVEFGETPAETAYWIARIALGNAVDYHRIQQLNFLQGEDGIDQYTFALHVKESATSISRMRGFQWITPSYREVLEKRYPALLGDGVASTYRRALMVASTTI